MGSKRNAWRAVAVLLSLLLFAACGGGRPATAPGQASVEEDWLPAQLKNIGVTSGASTPDVTLFEIIQKIVSMRGV